MSGWVAGGRRRAGVGAAAVVVAGVLVVSAVGDSAYAMDPSHTSARASGVNHGSGARFGDHHPLGPAISRGRQEVAALFRRIPAIQGGGFEAEVPEQLGFDAVTSGGLKEKLLNEPLTAGYTVIAAKVQGGQIQAAKLLVPDLKKNKLIYREVTTYTEAGAEETSSGKQYRTSTLEEQGYRNLFAKSAPYYPAGAVTDAITKTIAKGGILADALGHLYRVSNWGNTYSPEELTGELPGYDIDNSTDRASVSGSLARLAAMGFIKRTKEPNIPQKIPAEYQAFSPEEMAVENARTLQERVNSLEQGTSSAAKVLNYLYKNNGAGFPHDFNRNALAISPEMPDSVKITALKDLADAGLITETAPGVPGNYGQTTQYRLKKL